MCRLLVRSLCSCVFPFPTHKKMLWLVSSLLSQRRAILEASTILYLHFQRSCICKLLYLQAKICVLTWVRISFRVFGTMCRLSVRSLCSSLLFPSQHTRRKMSWLVDSPQPSASILEPSTFSSWSIYSQFSKHLSLIFEADLASFSRDLASVSWSTFKQNLWHNMPLIFLSKIPIAQQLELLFWENPDLHQLCALRFFMFSSWKKTPKKFLQ